MFYLNKEWLTLKGKLMDEQDRLSMEKNALLGLFILIGIISFFYPFVRIKPFPYPISDVSEAFIILLFKGPFLLLCLTICYMVYKLVMSIILVLNNLKFVPFFINCIVTSIFVVVCVFAYLFYFSYLPKGQIWAAFLLFVLNIVLAVFVHFLPFLRIFKLYDKDLPIKDIEFKRRKKLYFFSVISPDFVMAAAFKEILDSRIFNITCGNSCAKDIDEKCECNWEQRKVRIKYFIVFSNWTNLLITLVFAGVVLGAEFLITDWKGPHLRFLLGFLILRIVSRGFEIAFAFYKDVVEVKSKAFWGEKGMKFINYWRTSSLRRPERISLAIHSYLEIILLFSLFYFFLVNLELSQKPCDYLPFLDTTGISIEDKCVNKKLIEKNIPSKDFKEFLLYSSSVTFFNFSFDTNKGEIWNLFHVLQVFLSIILIVLSLAAYIGMEDKLDEKDEYDFILTNYYNEISKNERKLKGRINEVKALDLKIKIERYKEYIKQVEEKIKVQEIIERNTPGRF